MARFRRTLRYKSPRHIEQSTFPVTLDYNDVKVSFRPTWPRASTSMELLLNLLWLTLVLPAIWVWRRHDFVAQPTPCQRIRVLVLLCCILTLLFPVVSATDDLHAMRPELEESSPTQRIAKLSPADRCRLPGAGALPIQSNASLSRCPRLLVCGQVIVPSAPTFSAAQRDVAPGRAPPS